MSRAIRGQCLFFARITIFLGPVFPSFAANSETQPSSSTGQLQRGSRSRVLPGRLARSPARLKPTPGPRGCKQSRGAGRPNDIDYLVLFAVAHQQNVKILSRPPPTSARILNAPCIS
ncbi:hypothetical protein ABW21_db0206444 [Orbilia brochopaga]|nr:hypothetical protein ABW21_db0206444 [Drechslerella brochopaga]